MPPRPMGGERERQAYRGVVAGRSVGSRLELSSARARAALFDVGAEAIVIPTMASNHPPVTPSPAGGPVRGAVDFRECPRRRCRCGTCAVCGYQKHTGIHGPIHDQPPGSKPWGHEYIPLEIANR